jgi:hypothetical protein
VVRTTGPQNPHRAPRKPQTRKTLCTYLVCEELDAAIGSERLAPGLHHEGIVARDAVHLVHALPFDGLALLDVARHVAGGADWHALCVFVSRVDRIAALIWALIEIGGSKEHIPGVKAPGMAMMTTRFLRKRSRPDRGWWPAMEWGLVKGQATRTNNASQTRTHLGLAAVLGHHVELDIVHREASPLLDPLAAAALLLLLLLLLALLVGRRRHGFRLMIAVSVVVGCLPGSSTPVKQMAASNYVIPATE